MPTSRRRAAPTRGELQALLGDIFDGRTACEACGVVGEFEQAGQRKVCGACHAGCGVDGCREAYGEGRSPAEARLWRLASHARASDDAADMPAFRAALASYEQTEGSKHT